AVGGARGPRGGGGGGRGGGGAGAGRHGIVGTPARHGGVERQPEEESEACRCNPDRHRAPTSRVAYSAASRGRRLLLQRSAAAVSASLASIHSLAPARSTCFQNWARVLR